MAMKNFRPDVIVTHLESLRRRGEEKPLGTRFFSTPEISSWLMAISIECRNADLPLSVVLTEKIQASFAAPATATYGSFIEMVHVLFHRTCDEFAAPPFRFLAIAPEKAKLLQPAPPFGYDVAKAFPRASDDILEATKCYALERYTASVFHLMRAIEIGLDPPEAPQCRLPGESRVGGGYQCDRFRSEDGSQRRAHRRRHGRELHRSFIGPTNYQECLAKPDYARETFI